MYLPRRACTSPRTTSSPSSSTPHTGQVLPRGETGELVITTLTKEGFPLLRYRTKDLTRLNYEPCKCGRTFVRMDKIKGRSDDMLKIRGVNVFPTQIESVLVTLPHIGPHYQLILRREGYMDTLEVRVELTDGTPPGRATRSCPRFRRTSGPT